MSTGIASVLVQLGNSATTIVAAPNPGAATIVKANISNLDSGNHTVTLYNVPSGGNASTSNIMVNAYPIGAGLNDVLPVSGQGVDNGATIQALADTAGVVNLAVTVIQS